MRLDWRASAIAAAAAFLLSLIAGIFGGVAFGAILLRGLIGAVIFAAGAGLVSYVIDRFLPDLKASLAAPGRAEEPPGPGSQVDIVVDDEPIAGATGQSDFELEEADAEPLETGAFRPGLQVERVAGEGPDDDGEFADEDVLDAEPVDETEPETAGTGRRNEPGQSSGVDEAEPVDLEEVGPEDDDEQDGAGSGASLPDIGEYSESFSDAPADLDHADDSGRSGQDGELMARAIRTVLKREE